MNGVENLVVLGDRLVLSLHFFVLVAFQSNNAQERRHKHYFRRVQTIAPKSLSSRRKSYGNSIGEPYSLP